MTPAQMRLVRETWPQLQADSGAVAALFHQRLFELAPELRALFKGDLQVQGAKLMRMIGTAVRGLEHPEILAPALEDLGRRHARFGVRPDDYATVAVALLWTFEKRLGERFTADVRMAWTEVYLTLAAPMQSA